MQRFESAAIGEIIRIPVTSLRPSQPDDSLDTKDPSLTVDAALIDGEPLIIDGYHRYYSRFRLTQADSIPYLRTRKTENPYT